jgi:pyruvate/2-oxoglutarate dehydrogenase complex dihydrolipoamide dehydrogenase (E3) component
MSPSSWMATAQGCGAEALLLATGRRPRVTDDTLTRLGLEPGSHVLQVDDRLRVTVGVWAVGDVTGQGAFTPVATYQADVAGRDILGRPGPRRTTVPFRA